MMVVVVATDLWVTVEWWLAGSLIFSVRVAIIETMCADFDYWVLVDRLVWAEQILRHL
jgi:uncharacterized membrane protein